MEKVDISDVRRSVISTDTDRRVLTDVLGTSDLGMAYYEVAPGEKFSGLYHTHYDQEEVFYVQSGTATFRTEDGPVTVGAGDIVRFGPGEYQQGYNEGDETVIALAIGAPGPTHSHEELEAIVKCPTCREETPHTVERTAGREGVVLACRTCDTEAVKTHRVPGSPVWFHGCEDCDHVAVWIAENCPECGGRLSLVSVPDDWTAAF